MRTLRNAIGWSYDLLDASEQRMWRWLSIFSGVISLEAIEAFPATDESGARSSLDILSQLVSRSLLRTVMIPGVSPRYVMLESLRAFGVDQLLATGEEIDARTWHAQWFASVVAATAPHYADAGQLAMLDTFSLEWDNIRQALTWFREREEVGSILALCSQLWRFWSMRGMATEGRKWAADALAASATEITPRRAETCIAAAYLAEDQNDLDEAERFLYAALAIFEQLGDRARVAATLSGLGSVAHDRRDYPKALEWHRRAVEAAEASGDPRTRAVALGNLGGASYLQGNYHLARSCCEQAVVILGELGDQHGEAILLSNLGAQLLELDDLVAARDVLERALVLVRGIGDLKSIGCNLINLAEVYFRDDDGETALPMLAEARELLRQTGNNGDAAIGQIALTRVLLERGDVRLALSTIRESLVVFREVEDFASAAEATELLARIAVTIGAMAEARTLFANADLLRDVVRAPMRPSLVAETMQAKQRVPDLPGSIVRGTGPAETLPRTPQGIMATVCQLADILERRVTARTGEVGGRSSDERVDRGPAATVPPGDLAPAAFAARRYALSSRELEVLRLLAEGKSTRTIADELFISPRTVATHVTNILGKLEVNSRAAAVAMSLRLHLV
jgi:DNA-binding CsgD family transcriptional regulator/tetratricopeptide (TPR) repeat protein